MANEEREKLEANVVQAKTKTGKIDALHKLAKYLYWFDVKKAQQINDQATELLSKLAFSYKKGMADNFLNHAFSHTLSLKFADAQKDALQAISLYEELEDNYGISEAYGALYLVFYRVGDYTHSLDFALSSLDAAQNCQDNRLIGLALGRVGQTYTKLQDAETALSYYEQVLQLGKKIEDNYLIMLALLSYAQNLNKLQRYEEALEYGFQALDLANRTESTDNKAHANNFIGNSFWGSGQLQKALDYQQVALRMADEADNDYARAMYYRDMGLIYQALNEPQKALEAIHLSTEYAEKHNFREEMLLGYELLIQLYKSHRDFENALKYSEKYQTIQMEIHNKQNRQYRQHLMVQHETEQALQEASYQRALREQEQRQFKLLNQAKDNLIATASHDLKNPLAILRLTVELLERSIKNPVKSLEYINRLRTSVDRMEDLILNVLDLAILDTRQSLKLEKHDIVSLIKKIIEDYSPLAIDNNVAIHFDTNIEHIVLSVDHHQLRRAIENLLSNAIKYTTETDTIEVRIVQPDKDKYVCINISDHGSGIPAKDLPHIFDRFFRVKQNRDKEGTGLGLTIVKSIVEQHGGKITVESQMGKGTSFCVCLPA